MDELIRAIERQMAQNWSLLKAGQEVLVTEGPDSRYHAIIDDLTEDRSVVWVIGDGTRRAFDYREGVVITPA